MLRKIFPDLPNFKTLRLKKYSVISIVRLYFICALCHLPSSVLGRRIRASTAKEPSAFPGDGIWQEQMRQWAGGSLAMREKDEKRFRIVINEQCHSKGVGWCLFMGPGALGRHSLGLGICFREAQSVEGRGWGHISSCKDITNSDLLRTYYCQELTLAGRVEGRMRNTIWIRPATIL